MRITVNGETLDVESLSPALLDVLDALSFPQARIAVERNGTLITRDAFASTEVTEGDVLEVVTLVGGG